MGQFKINPEPCSSCPYRRDTPPGIWDREEYDKLPAWDDEKNMAAGAFLCHQGQRQFLCRGWSEVHHRNWAVRIALLQCAPPPGGWKPCAAPLYETGAKARLAGLRGIKKPGKAARQTIAKLIKARAEKGVDS